MSDVEIICSAPALANSSAGRLHGPVFHGAIHDVVWLVIFLFPGLISAGRLTGLDDGLLGNAGVHR